MNKQYPIGTFDFTVERKYKDVSVWMEEIKELPLKIKAELYGLPDEVFDTPYRKGGWTVRQVVHHLCDSHMNALIRVKLALTEDNPTIKPYDENAWANLGDYEEVSMKSTLRMLTAIHEKWSAVLENMTKKQFKRTFHHPESKIDYTLIQATAHYAWHCNHHLAHIQLVTQNR
ncbi:MAG: putative metal-dependent hydrolase [Balneolaceae bacterium]